MSVSANILQSTSLGELVTLGSVFTGFISFGVYFGGFKARFTVLEENMARILASVENLNECITEIQTVLKAKLKGVHFDKQTISLYSHAKSPLVLKDQYKPLVSESYLDREVEHNKKKLIAWLKSLEPKTGLDAQDEISTLVLSEEIENFLNLTHYKQYMYEHGKTTNDALAILAIYLFEVIIPEAINGKVLQDQ